jgi:hypothetical protein
MVVFIELKPKYIYLSCYLLILKNASDYPAVLYHPQARTERWNDPPQPDHQARLQDSAE